MRAHVRSIVLILGLASLGQAAAYDRRQEAQAPTSTGNIANGLVSMMSRLGMGGSTVTETVLQTITVGGGGEVAAAAANGTTMTVTVTAPASTVTVCPSQAQGAAAGVDTAAGATSIIAVNGADNSGGGASPVAHGGIGVIVISVPEDAKFTSSAGAQGAASSQGAPPPPPPPPPPPADAVSSGAQAATSSSLQALPTQDGSNQPGLSPLSSVSNAAGGGGATSSSGLSPLPSSAAAPIVGAPASDSSGGVAGAGTSLATLPGLTTTTGETLAVIPTGSGPIPTPVSNPPGAFGGSAGLIPISEAAVIVDTATTAATALTAGTTPGVANGAGVGPSIDVSGLTLSSQLNLGNLAQQTAIPTA